MRITHVIFGLRTGGTELLLIDIARCQAEMGHDVTILIINRSYEKVLVDAIDPRVKVVLVNRPPGSKNPWGLLKYNYQLRKTRPDVVHFHQNDAVKYAFKWSKTPFVVTVHAVNLPLPVPAKTDWVFAISDAVKEDIKRRWNRESIVVMNGIAFNAIQRKTEYSNPSQTNEHLHIVSTGRLDHAVKGQHLLVEACGLLRERGTEVKITFIGDGPSKSYLQKLADEIQVNDLIEFLGTKSRKFIYSHLKDYDLAVQPSVYEGFGLAIAEAMEAGLPVIVSDIEGPMQVIANGKYGMHFVCGDAHSLANAIEEAIRKYPVLVSRTKDCAAYVEENFGIEQTAQSYIANYPI